MANSGTAVQINLLTSLNVDTINENVRAFGDQDAEANANTGIEREGGITNIRETEQIFAEAGFHFQTEGGQELSAIPSGAQRIIKVDGSPVGQVSAYGVESRADILGVDDAALTADNTYLTVKISGTTLTLSEFSLVGVLLHTRDIVFVNLVNYIQYYTSLSFIRYSSMHYIDSQEFALRLGDQMVILKESDPGASVPTSLGSTTVLGAGNAIYCSVVFSGFLVVAGANGRVGSFDGANWRNYDGTGSGLGPFNGGSVTGNADINAMAVFGSTIVVGGFGGKLGSFDGLNWHNYDGTGGGNGVFNNATLIGANAINAMAVWTTFLVVGGVGGRVGCTNGTTYYPYTQAVSDYKPTSNALVIGANDVKAMGIFLPSSGLPVLLVAGVGGLLGSWDAGGWINSSAVKAPTDGGKDWTARTNPAAVSGWRYVTYGNGVFVAVADTTSTTQAVMTSPDGITWTARTNPAASGGWRSVTFGNGVFVAVALTTSTTQAVMTSPDGITWTARTNPAAALNGWDSVTYGNGVFVAVADTTSTTQAVMTSPDGITWTARTNPAASGGWAGVTFGNGVFVAVAFTTSTTQAVMTSPDGITWTARTNPAAAAASGWIYVAYGNGVFVAVALTTSTTQAVMTSPDGITWTARTNPAASGGWRSVTFGNGVFVAVAFTTSTTQAVMTSPDGITWTARTNPAASGGWIGVAYGNGVFVAVAFTTSTSAAVITAQASVMFGISNNATAVSTDTITAILTDTSLVIIGGSAGKVASFNGAVWANYNAGSGLTSNAAVCGANSINTIVKFGTTYVLGADTGRMGSWDGSNWKNYDGTGTGTGISNNQTLVGTSNIRAMAVLNSLLHVQSASGADNTISASGAFVPPYNNGGTPVVNLLSGMTTIGGLYVFRYEVNGLYFINLTGNNLNTAYILDNTSLAISVLKCRYAFPQTSGGLTRHVLTETPRTNGSEVFAVSTVGYVGFTAGSFVQVQVYPVTGLAASGINSGGTSTPYIGFNYADFCFKLTASATNVYNWLSPVPIQNSPPLYKVYQGNTDTNINGYGKLNNVFGLASSLPFEFRVVWVNGEQVTLSVAVIDGLASDCLGTLLTNLGEFDPSYTPHLVGDSTLLYLDSGVFKVVKIGTVLDDTIQKIGPRLYKINTVSPLNIFDAKTSQLCLGSIDYHGQMLFDSLVAPSTAATPVASSVTDKYVNSIDPGDKLVFIPSVAAANLQILGNRLPSQATIAPVYSVDTYINDIYSFSTLSSGLETVLSSRQDLLYLPATTLPVAIGGTYSPQTVGYPNITVVLVESMEVYEPSNELSGTYAVFQLFGQLYLFDGQWIYQTTLQGGLLGNIARLAPADGLTLVAVAPTRAHFVSSFDNSLYTFDGGRSLSKAKRLTMLEPILDGVFNVLDNTLLLQTANTLVWIRDDVATLNQKKASQKIGTLRLYDTVDGVVLGNDTGQWTYPFEPVPGSTVVPLVWASAYFGMDQNQKSIVKSFVVTIKANAGVSGFLTLDSFDQDVGYQQREPFTIKASDLNRFGYARLRIQPRYQEVLGMQIGLSTNALVLIQDVTVLFLEGVNAPTRPDLSK